MKCSHPTVSIIMPMHNDEEYVNQSISSIIAQTFIDWELIVVDDYSSDKSVEIVESFADDRIILVKNKENEGAAYSRNRAIALSKGKYIAFLDADDLWFERKLELQLDFMKKNSCSFCYSDYFEVNKENEIHHIVHCPKKISIKKMYKCDYIGCLTAIFCLNDNKIIHVDPRIKKRNDYAMWLQVIKISKTALRCPGNLAFYRVKENSISHSNKTGLFKWHINLFRIQENKTFIVAFLLSVRNVYYVFLKKIFLRRKAK